MTQIISQTRAAASASVEPIGPDAFDHYRARAYGLRDAAIDAAFKTIAARLNAVFAPGLRQRELPLQSNLAAPCR